MMLLIILAIVVGLSLVGIFSVIIYACATTEGVQYLCVRLFCGKARAKERTRQKCSPNVTLEEPYSMLKEPNNPSRLAKLYQSYRLSVPNDIESVEYEDEPRVRTTRTIEPREPESQHSYQMKLPHEGIYIIPVSPSTAFHYDYGYSWTNDPAPEYHQPYLRGIIV